MLSKVSTRIPKADVLLQPLTRYIGQDIFTISWSIYLWVSLKESERKRELWKPKFSTFTHIPKKWYSSGSMQFVRLASIRRLISLYSLKQHIKSQFMSLVSPFSLTFSEPL